MVLRCCSLWWNGKVIGDRAYDNAKNDCLGGAGIPKEFADGKVIGDRAKNQKRLNLSSHKPGPSMGENRTNVN